jgi:hypothetical protein
VGNRTNEDLICIASAGKGCVVFGDSDACGEGATVTLTGADGARATTVADNYGDFTFDGLPANARFTVTVAGYGPDGFAAEYSNYGACVLVTAPTRANFATADGAVVTTPPIMIGP